MSVYLLIMLAFKKSFRVSIFPYQAYKNSIADADKKELKVYEDALECMARKFGFIS